MFTRKTRNRLKHLLNFASAALILNLTFPIQALHASTKPSTPVISHAVIEPVVAAPVELSSLPAIPDKPEPPVKGRFVVRASAYSSTVDQTDGDPFTTASGAKVHDGTLAMNGIPFGTRVRIPDYYGDKIFTIEDRMHPRWGNKKIDIWMPTRAAAKQWGVRTITVEILK